MYIDLIIKTLKEEINPLAIGIINSEYLQVSYFNTELSLYSVTKADVSRDGRQAWIDTFSYGTNNFETEEAALNYITERCSKVYNNKSETIK